MTGDGERSFQVPGLDLRRRTDPTGDPEADRTAERWWTTRTPDGPGTLRVVQPEPDALEATAWGPGTEWLLAQAPRWVGAEDDVSTFDPPPGRVRELHRRHPGLRLGRTDRVYETTVKIVLGQKVQAVKAHRAFALIKRTHGDPAPGPDPRNRHVLPPPERLAELGYHDFHPFGVERKRATIVLEVARRASRLEEIVSMSAPDADRRLQAVRGIGPWSAAKVRQIAVGDPDAVVVGDFNLPHLVSWALADEPTGDDDRMLELLEPYRGHRTRAVRLLKLSGMNPPRRGPKLAFPGIEQR